MSSRWLIRWSRRSHHDIQTLPGEILLRCSIISAQGRILFIFVCGDATKNIEVMCHTNPDCIAVDENIDMTTAKLITDQHNITLSGNIR